MVEWNDVRNLIFWMNVLDLLQSVVLAGIHIGVQ